MLSRETIRVQVEARYGLFTRDEFVSERVSYEVIPPSAAMCLLGRIFGKHEMLWAIQRIEVLNPIQFVSRTINEVDRIQKKKNGEPYPPISATQNRTQRTSRVLWNPKYILEAKALLHPYAVNNGHLHPKYIDQFNRRLRKGQPWACVFLGKREFVAKFTEPDEDATPIQETRDLGSMRLNINYDKGKTSYFKARLENGVVEVPQDYLMHVLEDQLKKKDPAPERFQRRGGK